MKYAMFRIFKPENYLVSPEKRIAFTGADRVILKG